MGHVRTILPHAWYLRFRKPPQLPGNVLCLSLMLCTGRLSLHLRRTAIARVDSQFALSDAVKHSLSAACLSILNVSSFESTLSTTTLNPKL